MDASPNSAELSITQLKGLNERKFYNNPDIAEFDILRNCIPTTMGSLARMNGIRYVTEITGEPILGFCQTNNSRRAIYVQTKTALYEFTSEEFFGGNAYVPVLVYQAQNEEETMAEAIILHKETSGTDGGASTTAFAQRKLTDIQHQVNPDGSAASFVLLASNQITLSAGKYRIQGWCLVNGATNDKAVVRLYNVTTAAAAWAGQVNENSDAAIIATANRNHRVLFSGYLDLAAPTVFEIQQKSSANRATNGYGFAQSVAGINEIFTWLRILQTA